MPTYEYECESCGCHFEMRQSMTADPLTECPECQGPAHRLISGGTGFILKGGGTGRKGQGCSFEQAGRTCCGRETPCGERPCGG